MLTRKPQLFLLCFFLLTAVIQSAPSLTGFAYELLSWQQKGEQNTPSSQGNVELRVVVRGKDGQVVRDLTKEDFRIFEDGQEQKIVSSSEGDLHPLTLGLLLQWSGQRRKTLPYAEIDPALRFFTSVINKSDAAFLARFSNTVEFQTGYLNDSGEIADNLRQLAKTTPYGQSALYDALLWACRERFSTGDGRRALVLVTDGHDNVSKRSLDEAIESALWTQTAIYVVDLAYVNPYVKGSYRGRVIESATQIADQTGGDIFFVRKPQEVAAAFSQFSDELRDQYRIVYQPTNAARNGKLRHIKIDVLRKGVRVLAPKGYFAPEK